MMTCTCPDCGDEIAFIDNIQTGDVRGNYVESDHGCDCADEWRAYSTPEGWWIRRWEEVGGDHGDWETVDAEVEDAE